MNAEHTAAREYYKRNLVFWVLFIGWLPVMVFIVIPVARVLNFPNAANGLALIFFAAVMAAGIWRANWNCPRCGERFYRKWWYTNSFSTKCVHCGFRPATARSND